MWVACPARSPTVLPPSTLLPLTSVAQGQAADIEIQANEILHHKLTLNGYLAEFTGQPMEQITVDTDRDFFMSAQARGARACIAN